VSILCLGGGHIAAVGDQDEALAIRIMHRAIDEGVDFFDTAWAYGEGYSEQLMGKALKGGRRKKVFLMTKTSGRDTKFAQQCLEDSLRRLQVEHIDLWQFHEINWDNDPDWVFDRGGLKAALQAQKDGKVRFIGFTGHKDPRIHIKMLGKGYDWATAQMPINVMDFFYRSFQKEVVPVCLTRDVGIIGMKSLGGGGRSGGIILQNTKLTPEQCLKFALDTPISSLVRGWMTLDQMMADIQTARSFKPLSAAEKGEILMLAEPHAGDGRYELFKSTQRFDNPLYRKMHGFPEES
jgi:predicted aldo/keto reductase-like oxidoreductase